MNAAAVRAVLLCLLLTGCTTIELGSGGDRKTLVGVVRINLPQKNQDLTAIDVSTLGLGWDSGPFLGWHNASWVIASPEQCHLLIIVRAPVEAANAAAVLDRLQGKPICVADFTHSLHPASR